MRKTMYRKLFQKHSLLQKMLLSILGLICIPLLGIQLWSFLQSASEFKKAYTEQYQTMLQSLAISFENETESLAQTAIWIGMDKNTITPVKPDASPYAISAAASLLARYNASHPLITSAGIYYRESDVLLHNEILTELSYFTYGYFQPNSQGSHELEAFLRSADSLACFATENREGCKSSVLFVAKPVSLTAHHSKEAVVFFTIDRKVLTNWCAVFLPSSSGFCILSADGVPLLSSGPFTSELLEADPFRQYLDSSAESIYSLEDSNPQIVYKYRDISSEYIFLTAVPQSTAEGNVIQFARHSAWLLLFTVLIACVFLGITLYINYKPIVELVSRHIEGEEQADSISELDLLDSRFFALDKKISDQERLLATFIAGDLLSGERVSQEDVDRYFSSAYYSYFVVAIAEAFLSSAQVSAVSERFSKDTGNILIITTLPERPEMVLVCGLKSNIDIYSLRNHLQQLLSQTLASKCSLFFGSVVASAHQIQQSYWDALSVNITADSLAICKDDIYPSDLIVDLEQHLDAGNTKMALQVVHQLETAALELRPAAKRFFFFQVVNAYLSYGQKRNCPISNTELDRLISLTNGPQMFQTLRQSIIRIQEEAGERAEPAALLREKMLNYINHNYTDSSLCLTSIADYLQTSSYTVSRLFKQTTNSGFKEYITKKRLEKACHLLVTSTLSVTEIAATCGFESISYFGAVFKNVYGISPTKYRENANS